ncbi:MAG: helix-turn-helix transcriptional regulator [Spirochaetia bacterium]|nr:helix-turn-helix transcriptional regulator [Spirochaetia bacterium]
MVEVDKKYIGQILQNARKENGLKQAQLAELVGISEKHLSKIETGKNYPALDNFLKLISILHLSFNDFGIEESQIPSEKKETLKRIINTSSDNQLDFILDMINVIKRHN